MAMIKSAYDMLRTVAPGSEAGPAATTLPIAALHRDPTQPRQRFDEVALAELAASIEQTGIIEPLVVTPDPEHEGEWIILVGERRHRAAEKAGLSHVPVVVRTEVSESDRLLLQLTENDQRQDLTLREKGEGYMRLRRMLPEKRDKQLAEMLGKKPSTFAHTILAAKVTKGPAFEALDENIIKDPEALRLFLDLGDEDQKKLVTTARATAVTLTRLMLQKVKDNKKKPESAKAKRAPVPPGGLGSESSNEDAQSPSGPALSSQEEAPASQQGPAPRTDPPPAPKGANEYLAALTWRHWEILFRELQIPLPEDPDDAGYTLLEFLEARAT
ncbi:MAG TPA: ParB/RepB/Spo0J family partition protein [Thermoanaerobaculia bacterium]|nr:ParB/RepB/Spo0J family partition protein [Thermoanaerobaculia bacterium]